MDYSTQAIMARLNKISPYLAKRYEAVSTTPGIPQLKPMTPLPQRIAPRTMPFTAPTSLPPITQNPLTVGGTTIGGITKIIPTIPTQIPLGGIGSQGEFKPYQEIRIEGTRPSEITGKTYPMYNVQDKSWSRTVPFEERYPTSFPVATPQNRPEMNLAPLETSEFNRLKRRREYFNRRARLD